MVKPSDVSNRLRQIAAGIDKSKSPKPELVASDLQEVLDVLENPEATTAEPPPAAAPPAAAPAAE